MRLVKSASWVARLGAGGFVDPPGREISHPRVQKNERPVVTLATAELLDGARVLDRPPGRYAPGGEGPARTQHSGNGDALCDLSPEHLHSAVARLDTALPTVSSAQVSAQEAVAAL